MGAITLIKMGLNYVIVYHPIKKNIDLTKIIILTITNFQNQKNISRILREFNKEIMVRYFQQKK